MVWMVPFPAGPYGDYEGPHEGRPGCGWWYRLEQHFANDMREEERAPYRDRSYWYCVHEKFQSHSEGLVPNGSGQHLPPIQPHEPPTFFKYDSGHKSPACIISFPGMVLGCSHSFMELVEQLEPSRHRFFPIDVRNRRGPVYQEPHYVMVIGQRLNAPSFSLRTLGLQPVDESRAWHLWMDLSITQNPVFLSDQIVAEVKARGMKMPRLSTKMAA